MILNMKKYLVLTFILFLLVGKSALAEEDNDTIIIDLNEKAPVKTLQQEQIQTEIPVQSEQPKVEKPTPVLLPKFELNDRVFNYSLTSSQIPPDTIVYSQTQKYYNFLDPQKRDNPNSYYPGLRGPNQLIIYTSSYGERTGTNEFGTEAIVENNMVVRLNGADSVIPKNGFVISGHGSAKNWITKNLQVGSKVYIDYFNGLLNVYLTPESLIYSAKTKIKEVDDLIAYYKRTMPLYDYKKANEYLNDSKNLLKKAEKKPEKTQEYITESMEAIDKSLKNAMPYFSNELKGIWIRPVENTPEKIEKTIERLHSAGITDIFLETYYHGKTIYPSNYLYEKGVISQREEFRGFDPLAVWINESHKRNMKVHIWFESFYVGNENPKLNPNHVLSVYPYWANKRYTNYDSEEIFPCASEHNGFFLDPANYQVQSYLLGLLEEIINVYQPDGINLDYIRYPQSVEPSYSNYLQSNWGYTSSARTEFKLLYDIDPIDIAVKTNEWDLWSSYRQSKINDFVKNVKSLTSGSNILLTAVVFPDLNKSKSTKMQNWRNWAINSYVDGLTPLILTGDKNTADILLRDVFDNVGSSVKIYPGLFVTFMGGPYEDLLVQIQKTREFKSKGSVLFDYAHFGDKYIDALKTRVYNASYDERELKPYSHKKDYIPEIKYNDVKKGKKRKH